MNNYKNITVIIYNCNQQESVTTIIFYLAWRRPNIILCLQELRQNEHYQVSFLEGCTIFTPQLLYPKTAIFISYNSTLKPAKILSYKECLIVVQFFPPNGPLFTLINLQSAKNLLNTIQEIASFLSSSRNMLCLVDFNNCHHLQYESRTLPLQAVEPISLLHQTKTEEMLDQLHIQQLPFLYHPGIPIHFLHNSSNPIIIGIVFNSSFLTDMSHIIYRDQIGSDLRYLKIRIMLNY